MFKLSMIGNLTGDPQIQDNRASFTIAARTNHRNQDNTNKTEFVRVTVWGKTATTVATYCHKGDKIFVSGDGYTDEFVGRDGAPHWQLQCNQNTTVELISDKRTAQAPAQSAAPEDDDVLPD